ncbi:prickle 3 isoform X1 [Brachionus plicatilis]|uniref:Prickle 3 isoform X1 n=1 Tax=Brachionus plicatilis TaxID=10195 RepID=A0A3M7SNG2_BRAPC|nr:prickle 3 isoform X1 [Brachionus plicatilis]
MLKHNRKTPGNKKRVRYGPVKYVNLKLDEPIFTNTYQLSELCQKCGTVRSGPHINEGCKNCSVPKPANSESLNKNEFLTRTKRSLENLNEVNTEKFCINQKSTDLKDSQSHNQNLNLNNEFDKKTQAKQIHKKVGDEKSQNLVSNEHQLHSNDEISILSFGDKIKLLEKNFHPRELKPRNKSNLEREKILQQINKSQELLTESESIKKYQNNRLKKSSDVDSSKKENKVPRRIRNLYNNSKNLNESDQNLSDFDKKSIAEFENKLKFFEKKNSVASTSTRSLESFEPKSIFVETYQTRRDLTSKEFPIFGSNKSLDHSHFHVDNLNDIPRILGSISKTNIDSSNKDHRLSCETLDQISKIIPREINKVKEKSEGKNVPQIKPRKILQGLEKKSFEESFHSQNDSLTMRHQNTDQKIHIEKFSLCKACGGVIKSECIEAEGFFWHLEHFCCSECKCFLADKKYLVSESDYFCLSCHQKKFSKICQTCKLGIDTIETRFTYEKLNWHSNPNCFKCYRCIKKFNKK